MLGSGGHAVGPEASDPGGPSIAYPMVATVFELRAWVSRWFAQRGVPAVAEIVGDGRGASLEVRTIAPMGAGSDPHRFEMFPIGVAPAEEQIRSIIGDLSRRGWWTPPGSTDTAGTSVWCAPG